MQDKSVQIQPYNARRDESAVLALWQQTVGQSWPIQADRLQQVLVGPEAQHFVVRENAAVIGFTATCKSSRAAQKVGHLAALLVAPHRQGQGIGTALYHTALNHLHGLSAVQLGSTSPRFWCGVPDNLPLATTFFRTRGWQFAETVYDIVQNVHNYTTPLKKIFSWTVASPRLMWVSSEKGPRSDWACPCRRFYAFCTTTARDCRDAFFMDGGEPAAHVGLQRISSSVCNKSGSVLHQLAVRIS